LRYQLCRCHLPRFEPPPVCRHFCISRFRPVATLSKRGKESVPIVGRTTLRLLVIDDDPGTLSTCSVILRRAGYKVVTASSADDGLMRLQTAASDFHLILLDLKLPDQSGLEVLAELRHSSATIPVVMMSAWSTPALEAASRLLGAVDFLRKPIDPDGLVIVIRENLVKSGFDPSPLPPTAVEHHPPEPAWDPWADGDVSEMPPPGYAAARWANVVVAATTLKADMPTLENWGSAIRHASATLRMRCVAAGVHADVSLDFARMLRIVKLYAGARCDWYNVMDIADERTLKKLLHRAGLSINEILPDIETFLRKQQFITLPTLLSAVRRCLGLSDPK
jgi:CheY-like chemotaxis protein